MARRRKKNEDSDRAAPWLITFSDLMTLLLTFFVLLLSMSSMDSTIIARISAHTQSLSPISQSGLGRIPERIRMIVQMIKDPYTVLEKRRRLKDLLFPGEVLPRGMSRSTLEENLEVLAHPEGVVIVLTDSLLFAEGTHTLDPVGKALLDALTPVMHAVNADIHISGHAEAGADGGTDGYELSFMRAASVLEHFLQEKLPPDRFSLGGYGSDNPPQAGAALAGGNRRVEILVKSTPRAGSYL